MELLVIRHGQSEADILKRHEGRADFQLSELGITQANHMANWVMKHYQPDMILSSPLLRARMTAQILGVKTNLTPHYFDELMEFNNGLIAGLSFEEAKEKYPYPKDKLPHESYYEQETLIEFRARAEAIFSKIIHEYSATKRIAIVSHGGMINMLFRSFLQLPIHTNVSIHTGDTGIHLWKIEEENRAIVFSNRTEHLSF